MGAVFLAEDPELRRRLALKVMLPRFAADPVARVRFLREARAQAAVEHDHIVTIFQVGEANGIPYLTMPLLKGQTRSAALKTNPRPPVAEVLRVGREIAEGLAASHEAGLVHRDVKPSNVWLEGKRRRVKILDFGLARPSGPSDATDPEGGPLTASGAVVGTPAYMSPEQGRGKQVDHRTDLFSLGVVLYQMATGTLPFRGADMFATLTALALDTPETPGALNPAVPPALSGSCGCWRSARRTGRQERRRARRNSALSKATSPPRPWSR
jgi:serine/threonine protein kinase